MLLTAAHALPGSGNRKLLSAPSGSLSSSMAPEPDFTTPSTLLWGPVGAPGPLPIPDLAALSPEGQAVTQGEVNYDGVDVVAAARFSYGSAYPDLGEDSTVEESLAGWGQAVRCMPPVPSTWGLQQTPHVGPLSPRTVPVASCSRPAGSLHWAGKWADATPCVHPTHCAFCTPAPGQQLAPLARQLRDLACWCSPAPNSQPPPDLCCAQLRAA